ncbi:MAG: 2-isopropylmalate synthase, partial [Clostridiales bacterium]|nr:2-isopropylmalate synthase [Clostridiales bacterium]
MKETKKYKRQFFMPPEVKGDWMKKTYIDKAPVWCSVDLRDGNQSLMIPMSLDEKVEFFKLLVEIGFKEIEVGFPAASDTEYQFLRTLIDGDLIPDDVTIQVLTQSREHIIKKTFESLKGIKNENHVIVHLYNSTSVAQREQVFKKSKEEIKQIAVDGAKLFDSLAKEYGVKYRYEYSPESFTGTEPEYALDVCNAVLDVWQPSSDRKTVINLPVTVENSMPHVYASQIEYMCNHLKYRENVVVSLHPHNDRGCAVADCEMGLLAGADRIEGTLFGNGERTGNADIVTLAMNMYSQGVEPELDFTNMPKITQTYEKCTGMSVYERSPYAGALVFAAFSGSHQDAIAKGMKYREDNDCEFWTVPYLPIDPKDVGREYKTDVIRINSQSGKGGIGYLLANQFGYKLPAKMRESVGYCIKDVSDRKHKELQPQEVFDIFSENYINIIDGPVKFVDYHFVRNPDVVVDLTVEINGERICLQATGNGRLNAVSNALHKQGINYTNLEYTEHALNLGSTSKAVTYVSITWDAGSISWGVGVDADSIVSSMYALGSAVTR